MTASMGRASNPISRWDLWYERMGGRTDALTNMHNKGVRSSVREVLAEHRHAKTTKLSDPAMGKTCRQFTGALVAFQRFPSFP